MGDLISRQAAIDALGERPMVWMDSDYEIAQRNQYDMDKLAIETVPSAQPELHYDEWCTDCKEYDQERHCCPRFNRVIRGTVEEYKAEHPEPCDDPRADVYYLAEKIGIHRLYALVVELRGEPEPCEDAVSRQAAIDALDEIRHALWEIDIPSPTVPEYVEHHEQVQSVWKLLDKKQKELYVLPSVQPERTCVNCGRTVNNGGWYADGGTRCPIEEHYALPKNGYCHLWEKRNVTDDDYPERREE